MRGAAMLEETKSTFLHFNEEHIQFSACDGNYGDDGVNNTIEGLQNDCKIIFDCKSLAEESQDYSTGTTYFIGPEEKAAFDLEKLAQELFKHHTKDIKFDPATSGAEWWTQVIDDRDDIGFHWDRDYGIEEDTGQYIYPRTATVTYLSPTGGPTVIMDRIGTKSIKEDITTGSINSFMLSLPRVGKHIAFSGKLLHAAPSDMLTAQEEVSDDDDDSDASSDEENDDSHGGEEEEEEVSVESTRTGENSNDDDGGDDEEELASKNGEEARTSDDEELPVFRITFLVNIWINHRPVNAIRFTAPDDVKAMGHCLPPFRHTYTKESENGDRKGKTKGEGSETEKGIVIQKDLLVAGRCTEVKQWKFSNGGKKFLVKLPFVSPQECDRIFAMTHRGNCVTSSGSSSSSSSSSSNISGISGGSDSNCSMVLYEYAHKADKGAISLVPRKRKSAKIAPTIATVDTDGVSTGEGSDSDHGVGSSGSGTSSSSARRRSAATGADEKPTKKRKG